MPNLKPGQKPGQMKLRPYQITCLNAIKREYAAGVNRQLVVAPTASGKTVSFSRLPETIGLPLRKQMWVCVHRDELVWQSVKHLELANPGLKVGIEKAEQRAPEDADLIVASVQSIGKSGTRRLERFRPEKLGIMVLDECHHAAQGETYHSILKYFHIFKGGDNDSKALLCCWTATPNRSDGIGLEQIADKIVFQKDIREMISEGWLADIRCHRIESEIDLSQVKISHGDFAIKELEKTINVPERNALIVEKYKELAPGLPAVVFSCDVAHSHSIALEFRRNGIAAFPVSGQTPDAERKRLLAGIEDDTVQVLVSTGVLNEGWDNPKIQCGIMARPTKSPLLFQQQIGRVLRPYPAPELVAAGAPKIKQAALILDFVDSSIRHQLVTVPSLFGLNQSFDNKGQSITDTLAEVEAAQKEFKQLKFDSFRSLIEMRSLAQAIDLLRPPMVPPEITGMSNLTWFAGPGGSYQIVAPSIHLSVRQNQLGQFEISKHENGLRSLIRTYNTLRESVSHAENMVPQYELILVKAGAKWMNEAPSYKQIRLLSTLDPALFSRFGRDFGRLSRFIESSYTMGQVSGLINQAKMKKQARRAV